MLQPLVEVYGNASIMTIWRPWVQILSRDTKILIIDWVDGKPWSKVMLVD